MHGAMELVIKTIIVDLIVVKIILCILKLKFKGANDWDGAESSQNSPIIGLLAHYHNVRGGPILPLSFKVNNFNIAGDVEGFVYS